MMDSKKRDNEPEQTANGTGETAPDEQPTELEPDAVAEAGEGVEAPNDEAPAGESQAETIARLEAEKADLTERLLRLAADMDNLRKRTERDLAESRRYAMAGFAADMLTISDNLRRALDAVPEELRQAGDNGAAAVIDGVEMTARELDRLLAKHGVERIEAHGQRFDPHRHQAMFEVPDASVEPGTVVQVVQDGYTIGDRVLRAAMVGVSKAVPAEAAGGDGSEAESAPDEEPSRAARSG